jgi:hypothetical protein
VILPNRHTHTKRFLLKALTQSEKYFSLGSRKKLRSLFRKMKSVLVAIVVFAGSLAQAANHIVNVGSGGFVYSPNTVMAAVGDTVEFVVDGVCSRNSPYTYYFISGKLIFRLIVLLKLLSDLLAVT